MMRGANPGLARRFQWQNPWRFEDYSKEDLFHILKAAAWRKWVTDGGPNGAAGYIQMHSLLYASASLFFLLITTVVGIFV